MIEKKIIYYYYCKDMFSPYKDFELLCYIWYGILKGVNTFFFLGFYTIKYFCHRVSGMEAQPKSF